MSDTPDWPPTKCGMPELPPGGTAPYLAHILRGRGFFGHGTNALSSAFCRLVAQSADEYRLARESLVDYVQGDEQTAQTLSGKTEGAGAGTTVRPQPVTWRIGPLLRACGKLENCIQVLHRCVQCLKILRKQQTSTLKIDKNLSILRAADRIRGFRNAIDHLYNDIVQGKLRPEDPHTMKVADAEVRLREHKITYKELADWLLQLRKVSIETASENEHPPGRAGGGP